MSWKAWLYRFGYPCAKAVWFFTRPKTEGILAIIRNGNNILFLRQSYRTRRWCLCGGGIDAGESPRDACIREVFEETGLKATSATRVWTFPWTKEFKNDTVHLFIVDAEGTPRVDGDEIIATRWFGRDDLPRDMDDVARLALARTQA